MSLAVSGATKPHCQAIALDQLTVIFPKHCLTPLRIELLLPSPLAAVALQHIRPHPTLDLALATVAQSLPIGTFAEIGASCLAQQAAVSACVWAEGERKIGLRRQSLSLSCSAESECLAESIALAAGASGCPVFDADVKVLRALGYGWSRRGSHFVCMTRELIETLRRSGSAKGVK